MTLPTPSATAADADADAAAAASRAGVRIELVHDLAGFRTVRDIIDEVWRPTPDDRPVTLGVLRAMTHAGNYCSLAFDGQTPVGVCVAFLGLGEQLSLHSHIAGVVPAAAGRNIGRAVKLHQRAWALDHGVRVITWTYDPLVRRNAYFNANRLGALPVEYLVDFYGDMSDAINAGQHTDRLAVEWWLDSPRVAEICAGRAPAPLPRPDGAVPVLDVAPGSGEPVVAAFVDGPALPTAAGALVRLPADIEGTRRVDPDLARRWRLAAREVLGGLMRTGWQVTAVTGDGDYLLVPPAGNDRPEERIHP